MRISFLTLVLVLAAAVSMPYADDMKPKETRESSENGYVGKKVEPFKAVTVTGSELYSLDHGAKALIISLWGLNCGSCLDEMKVLQPLYEEFRGKGLKIWAVNTEDIGSREILDGLKSRQIEISYDLVPDPGLPITKLFTSWFIPVTVIVDSNGIVQYYKIGFNEKDAEKIKAKVGALLAQ